MNLYKVSLTRIMPKDYKIIIEEYVLANNDKKVFQYLKDCSHTYWSDINEGEHNNTDFIYENYCDSQIEDEWKNIYYDNIMYYWKLYVKNLGEYVPEALSSTVAAKLL